jgi:hypothetical protein
VVFWWNKLRSFCLLASSVPVHTEKLLLDLLVDIFSGDNNDYEYEHVAHIPQKNSRAVSPVLCYWHFRLLMNRTVQSKKCFWQSPRTLVSNRFAA